MIKRIHVRYLLRLDPAADREKVQRAFEHHMPRCPVYRSIGGGWEIRLGGGNTAAEPIVPHDSTGAGDAFTSTRAAALARGLPLPTAVGEANRAGAAATLWAGSQPWQL